MEHKEISRELEQLKKKSQEMYESINIDALKEKLSDLEKQSVQDGFWNDPEKSASVNKEISAIKRKIEPWDLLLQEINDASELLELAVLEDDQSIADEIKENCIKMNNQFDDLETLELLSDEDDTKNAFLTIHAGAGGTESQDWANMLLRMYLRWAEKQKFGIEYIDYNAGEEAGIKAATILLKGEYAYGLSKSEMGVHRLVRISPFDANKRRHTSFASVEVIAEIEDDIDIEVLETDLRIDTYRSSGAGGQHVNTTDSAVRITHIPTGIVVSCQNERSQHKNKAFAMKVLKSKLYEKRKEEILQQADEKSGEKKDIAWGSQIRSYVYQPYTLVKDHRTGEETGSVDYVMDGDLNKFIYAYLKMINKKR
ncbi:MAG: peptide chain release factor 2 [Spirochaetes bacterium]|nr:peptide chain release factor 2 [Spirochaetota bacterium]